MLCSGNAAYAEVYRWVDDKGRVHFGDKRQQQGQDNAENLSRQYSQPSKNFEVTVIPVNYKLPLDTKRKVISAVKKIFYVLNDYNNIPFTNNTSITIKIFGSQQEFLDYQKGTAPGAKSKTGFYSRKRNEAAVWKNKNVKSMLSVVTHEAFHTILWTNYKHTPVWLNEGFAEYFELINVFGTTAVVPPNRWWERTVQKAKLKKLLPPLAEFLDMDKKQWRELNKIKSLGYAMGWSLSFYLMSSQEGRGLIVDIFKAREKDKDAVISDIVNKSYAGGVAQLEINWHNWFYAEKSPHRY
jgi:hypothetical protein